MGSSSSKPKSVLCNNKHSRHAMLRVAVVTTKTPRRQLRPPPTADGCRGFQTQPQTCLCNNYCITWTRLCNGSSLLLFLRQALGRTVPCRSFQCLSVWLESTLNIFASHRERYLQQSSCALTWGGLSD